MSNTLIDQNEKRKIGILVVGLRGANGVTMCCGMIANRRGLEWRGPRGEHASANYNGCITQLKQRGVHGGVGFADVVPEGMLANVNDAAIGGWDVRPGGMGDALLEAQILDYDLVRQVKDEMNESIQVKRGYYDARFIGRSQHEGATHILDDCSSTGEALERIRADIREFKTSNNVNGHTTVIWSASVEPNCEMVYELNSSEELLRSIDMSEEERGSPLSPSLIYATAAILEGCSFVNGGSQNTLCGGLEELAMKNSCYCLGTDFKAGQTKFKTAAVEYLRTMGLTPKVIASSNHLGNNDMKNLATADKARNAKLRVKHDIFAAWEEDIDHKVAVMYTPMINDEKRDFVEYTSLGFMDQHHTMVTYTRASDSVLCVPLMIDSAVWCDFFRRCNQAYESVSRSLAYLFKVPEGGAKGVDPGFFKQMEELKGEVNGIAQAIKSGSLSLSEESIPSNFSQVTAEKKNVQSAGSFTLGDATIVCAGLACVDMQLVNATGGDGGESIDTFEGETSIGGGSVSMACKSLARMSMGAEKNQSFVSSIVPLCKVGWDSTGDKLLSLLESTGKCYGNVDTALTKYGRDFDKCARTALAVLPIYKDGRRGCFFDAASNTIFESKEVVDMLAKLKSSTSQRIGAFIFGYPHLLPKIQGQSLATLFTSARSNMNDGGLIVMDLNGVPNDPPSWKGLRSINDLKGDPVIGSCLQFVDILHLNEDELYLISGCERNEKGIKVACDLLLECGVGIVAVTRGKNGCFVSCAGKARFSQSKCLPLSWADSQICQPAIGIPPGATLNTNGAGDAFTAGFVVATMMRSIGENSYLSLKQASEFASLVAARHVDTNTRNLESLNVNDLLSNIL